MCGIAGVVHTDLRRPVEETLIRRMCDCLKHRGPDDEGVFVEGHVGLGMRRLAVIDLHTGKQPIRSEDGNVIVVFNGEIYNFQELRKDLIGRGHHFSTRTDTETIVHLYEEMGPGFASRLRGMFAIAIWDRKRHALVLSRDRLGVKPLYYRHVEHGLQFGSEIKAILQDKSVPRVPDPVGLHQMLTYGYTAPPTTCFTGISELPPATTLEWVDGEVRLNAYWDLQFTVKEPYDERDATEELLSRLEESVRLRMVSDVPLGALLSGGIDSSLIVALMSRLSTRPVKTFSIGFDDPSYSELSLARQVAERYKTDHHEIVVKPDVADMLPMLIRHHDAPFYDTSAIPTYAVCQAARQKVTVALSGDGGDESFAGYNMYLANQAAELYRHFPHALRDFVLSPLARLLPESDRYFNLGRVAREFTVAAGLEPLARYARWTSKVKEETRRRLYRTDALVQCLEAGVGDHLERLFRRQANASSLGQFLYADTKSELPNDVLLKVDRMSMSRSLEVRSPLLDHQVFEFAATLPDRAKIRRLTTKHLLRRLARDLLPPDLLTRPKHGFSVPLDRWIREDLAGIVSDVLLDPATAQRGYMHQQAVERLIHDHHIGPIGYGREIWTLLTIELWHRMYIDRFDRVESPGLSG